MKNLTRLFTLLTFVLFLAFSVVAAPQPVVYYKFDELDDVVEDASENGNDGTINGGVGLSDDGKIGKSFEFNGTDAYVELERVVQDDFTLMAWIKTNEPGVQLGNQGYQGSGLIWSDVGGVANDFILAVLGTKLSFFCGSPDLSVNSETDVVTGEWVHVASTRKMGDDGEIKIYIDGKFENTKDHANPNPLDALATIAIGGNVLDSRYYAGLVDEVKIFDVVLAEGEIQQALAPASVESTGKLAVTWAKIKSR